MPEQPQDPASASTTNPALSGGNSPTLFDLATGQCARITRIRDTGPRGIRQRLLDMGVTRGACLRVVRHAPLGDPVEVVVKDYHLALRMHEAAQIEVEVL